MDELDPVFDAVATYFGLLAEPRRLRILYAICEKEKTVSQIVDEISATQTNVSRHLGQMFRAGVLARRKKGNLVYYRIADASIIRICRTVCNRIADSLDATRPLRKAPLRSELVRLMHAPRIRAA